MITVETFLSNAAGSLHGTSMNRVTNPMDKLRQAAIVMLNRIEPYDTLRRFRMVNALYDRVYNYTFPTDAKGTNKIVDLRPIGPRSQRDEIDQTTLKQFDKRKGVNTLTVEDVQGIKTLRVAKRVAPQILLADLGSFQVPATVSVFGDAQNLTQNDLDYVTGNGSTQFDLSGVAGAGGIIVALPGPVDISVLLNLGSLFEWFNFPDATRLTNVNLDWGQSSSAMWSKAITAPNDYPTFQSQAWTMGRHDWQSATKTGSPDSTAINWLRLTFNYTTGAALTAVKVDSITASLGKAFELMYYSRFIFQNASTLAFQEGPILESDIIYVDPVAETILMYEFLKIISRDLKGKNMTADVNSYVYELEGDGRVIRGSLIANRAGLYRDYISQFPSQAIPVTTTYYDFSSLSGHGDDDCEEDW